MIVTKTLIRHTPGSLKSKKKEELGSSFVELGCLEQRCNHKAHNGHHIDQNIHGWT